MTPLSGGPLVQNLDSVEQALENILNTNKGERIFNPEFGINLDTYLGELVSEDTSVQIFTTLVRGIPAMDSRIVLQPAKCSVTADASNHKYTIVLVGYVKGIQNQQFNYIGELQRL